MAKRKAKKKSPPSSSRPPPSCPTRQVASGPSSPTRKLARHFSLPTLSLSDATPSLAALGNHGVDQTPSSTPPQPPCPKLLISENSPSFSELFAPIVLDSPGDSETDGSSAYNSDSNSHYGSPVLVSSELRGRHPSPSQAAAAPVPPSSFSAEKAVLSLEGAASVHALVSPLIDKDLQHPMVCEAASGLQDWQPVPKKHTSNRQPKISSDLTALTLQQGKSVAEVGYATGGADLSGMGGNAAGSARVRRVFWVVLQ
ncbi:hypothetical protein OIU78_025933 [Salix suchowensis]|nr:hypothetical protein OIU78_025933 [Salix suchowensis]